MIVSRILVASIRRVSDCPIPRTRSAAYQKLQFYRYMPPHFLRCRREVAPEEMPPIAFTVRWRRSALPRASIDRVSYWRSLGASPHRTPRPCNSHASTSPSLHQYECDGMTQLNCWDEQCAIPYPDASTALPHNVTRSYRRGYSYNRVNAIILACRPSAYVRMALSSATEASDVHLGRA